MWEEGKSRAAKAVGLGCTRCGISQLLELLRISTRVGILSLVCLCASLGKALSQWVLQRRQGVAPLMRLAHGVPRKVVVVI